MATATVRMQVTAAPGGRITNVAVDCACVRLLTPLPHQLDAAGLGCLEFRASGLRPGIELVQIATSSGIVRAHIQIVGPGAGEGRPALTAALLQALRERLSVLAFVHNLQGTVRNCGCSQGSLGGAGLLAGLPAFGRELAPGVQVRWVLTGDVDGMTAGLGAALVAQGWQIGDPTIAVAADPLPLLATPGLTAIVTTAPAQVQHARILYPTLPQGLAVDVLLVDGNGRIQARHIVPVDRTLPDVAGFAARFPERLSSRIDVAANPSKACASCHASAYAVWQRSAHARALDSLQPADRTDGCIGCHTTSIAAAVVAPAVHCQSCHSGSAPHVASGGTVKTTGVSDCRSCHDAKHHPAFQREEAWKLIGHGMEGK